MMLEKGQLVRVIGETVTHKIVELAAGGKIAILENPRTEARRRVEVEKVTPWPGGQLRG